MKTAQERSKLMKRLLRETKTWCDGPAADVHNRAIQGIEASLASQNPLRAAAVDLDCLGLWHARAGARRVLGGDLGGWGCIEEARQCYLWGIRLRHWSLLHQWTHALAHAIATEDWDVAQWLAAAMHHGHARWSVNSHPEHPMAGWIVGWETSPYANFLLQLWDVRMGREPVSVKGSGPGPYRRILDAWHRDADLAVAIENACDYHLEQTTDAGDDDKEFLDGPYDICPIEVSAIESVRRALGLTMPSINHPLMQTALAHLPLRQPSHSTPTEPLLGTLVAMARRQALLCGNPQDDFKPEFGAPEWNADNVGWLRLDKNFQYAMWQIRIQGHHIIDEWTFCLAYALVIGEDRIANWLSNEMLRDYRQWVTNNRKRTLQDGGILGWRTAHLAVFLVHLCALYTHAPAPDLKGAAGLGPYREVIDKWNDPSTIAEALKVACDAHVAETGARKSDNSWTYPYPHFPGEILAVIRVREKLGLPTPNVDHPLMSSPLVAYRPRIDRSLGAPDFAISSMIANARRQGFLPPEGGDDFAV